MQDNPDLSCLNLDLILCALTFHIKYARLLIGDCNESYEITGLY